MIWFDQGGRARGAVRHVAPPADLTRHLELGWIDRHDAHRAPPGTCWRIVPDASAHIIFTVACTRDGERIRCGVTGARSVYQDIDVSARRVTIGVRLHAGGLAAILRERAGALTDRTHAIDQVFGSAGVRLVERMANEDPDAALDRLMAFVRARVSGAADPDPIGAAARRASSVAGLGRALDLPVRSLHARTRDAIGLAPKRLLRIQRLYRAMHAAARGARWSDAAHACGFADQPHLVREFRALVGEPPETWAARGRPADSFKTRDAAER